LKAVILAGGLGTRISEETSSRPKPMVEIGGKPILWHIMKIFLNHGIEDFIICCGYKGYVIKEYFANYFLHMSDVTFDFASNDMKVHQHYGEPWKVTLVDTGDETMTGGRLKRVGAYLKPDEPFCFTYGDCLSNVDLQSLLAFHKKEGKLATVTGVQPPGRYGSLSIEGNLVHSFEEKPQGDGSWINGGFFVLQPEVLNYIAADDTAWESSPLEQLARQGELSVYRHGGFWHPMDTLRDKNYLEQLWKGQAPWKTWD
jgi:glucose-1-phosphate cytidylyltransferase